MKNTNQAHASKYVTINGVPHKFVDGELKPLVRKS